MPDLKQLLQALVREGETITPYLGVPTAATQERKARWSSNCRHTLEALGLPGIVKHFERPAINTDAPATWHARRLGILKSAIDLIDSGLTTSLRHRAHLEYSDSLLDQAEALLRTDMVIAAGVLVRIVLERWIRDKAETADISDFETAKVSTLNEKLRDADVFSKPMWRRIQSVIDVGNAAAHGKPEEFTAEDVRQALEFARAHCV